MKLENTIKLLEEKILIIDEKINYNEDRLQEYLKECENIKNELIIDNTLLNDYKNELNAIMNLKNCNISEKELKEYL